MSDPGHPVPPALPFGPRRGPARWLARAGAVAALYVGLTWATSAGPLRALHFGWPVGPVLVEFRVAESLAVLPILFPEAVPGLFVGVMLANLLGGLGPWDVFGGSLVTLVAAYFTWRWRRSWLAYASPVVLNGLLISIYLSALFGLPYWTTALGITLSEALVVLGLGVPLVRALRRRMEEPR